MFDDIRLTLASARATLRSAKDAYELARAEAEQRAVDAGVTGKNAEERSRALTLALAKDDAHRLSLVNLRRAEAEVDRLDAILESARDARRAEEWTIRARLADALLAARVQSDGDDPTGDAAFDDAADHMSRGRLESSHYANNRRPQPTYTPADEDLPF